MLKQLHPLSMKGSLLLVKMLMYYGDIVESFGATVEESCESYRKAESILNEQVGTNIVEDTLEMKRRSRRVEGGGGSQ